MKNSIEFWHDVCMEIVRRDFSRKPDGSPARPDQGGPTRTSRGLAIAHLAMHDAHFGTTSPADTYLQRLAAPVALPVPAGPLSQDSALGTAAAICLLTMYPSHKAYINRMSAIFIDPNPDPVLRDNGHRYGEDIAALFVALRANDKSAQDWGYRPSTAYGRHREDPHDPGQNFLTPQWGKVTHFCLANRIPLDPPPGYTLPDYLTDPDYRADLKEVKEEGALISTKRSPEEKVIGY